MPESEINKLVGHLFRQEAGKMAAVLTRLLGFENLDHAEDIVQDTLIKALSVWKIKGVPENPPAWLHTVAKRKAIDFLRQCTLHQQIHTEMAKAIALGYSRSPREGLEALLKIRELDALHFYHAALGDFYLAVKDKKNSMIAYDRALSLVTSKFERELLLKKKAQLL